MSQEDTTPTTQPGASQLNAADGKGAVDPVTPPQNGLTLDELNTFLGKSFKDKDTALKSLKDTYSYVGNQTTEALARKLGKPEDEVLSALKTVMDTKGAPDVMTRAQFQEEQFFDKNASLTDYRSQLAAIKNSDPATKAMTWQDFVKSPVAASLVEKVTGYDEIQRNKSVLESNPRLGAATDKIGKAAQATEEARKAAMSGDVTNAERALHTAKVNAVAAVREAYEM